jgi:signal transduction histidine kinase
MGIATDVTEAIRTRKDLEQKIVVEQLLSSVSGQLFALRPDEEPDGIIAALGKAAGYAGCDRAFLVAPAAGHSPQLGFSWSRTPGSDNGMLDDVVTLPWFETRLHGSGYLSVERLAELPIDAPAERRFCRIAGLTSLVAVPLGAERIEGGYLVFATTGWERLWSGDDVLLFRMVGEMLANVLARRRARTQLEDLVESKDQFIASVSHELRTPLASVVGLSEELRDRFSEFSEDELREFHKIVAEQAGELSAIVEDLLVVARIDINQVQVVCESVGVASEVDSVVAPLNEADKAKIHIRTRADIDAWCDRKRVRQVLRNLVMNALRHGGTTIWIDTRFDDGSAVVEVVDDGPGIPEGDHERIFEPYEYAGSVPGKPGSIGLGLTVARSLSRLMGGDLRYERRDGLSVFRLSLPVHDAASGDVWRAAG